jgi:putative DNA primase/helicase
MSAIVTPLLGVRDTPVSISDIPTAGSEDEYAEHFSDKYQDTLRYVASWGKWLQWDSARWKFETTLIAFDLARVIARHFSRISSDPDVAKASVIAAIERLARADRRHASTTDQWDVDQTLFNTPIINQAE